MPFPNPDTQFKPGVPPNPNGSSKKARLTARLNKMLDEASEESFIQVALDAAKDRDFNFWKYLYERIDGKLPEPEPVVVTDDTIMDELEKRAAERTSKKPASGHLGPVQE